jgi:flagellar biosynthetic protein FlhB
MAEDSYQDRTEQPTPKRRAEAREKGQVARSRDLSASLVLITGFGVLTAWNATMGNQSAHFLTSWLAKLHPGAVTPTNMPVLFLKCGLVFGYLLAPIWLFLVVVAVLANYLQGGWIFSQSRLALDPNRLNFFEGIKACSLETFWWNWPSPWAKYAALAW